MAYTIVSINRNIEATCECGSICEKVSYNVVNAQGDSFTYGSSCIKSVLGLDVSSYETKRGLHYINLEVVEYYKDTKAYFAQYKDLEYSYEGNEGYKVVVKPVYVWTCEGLNEELSKDCKTIYYKVKANKKQLAVINKVQDLQVGKVYSEDFIKSL